MDKLALPIAPHDVSTYTDFAGLARLKADAQNHSPETLKKVAQQFEALFLEMMLKSMREAKLGEGIFDSDASEFYQGMFDKQVAMDLAQGSGNGLGIAELLVRQLSSQSSGGPKAPPPAAALAPQQIVPQQVVPQQQQLVPHQAAPQPQPPVAPQKVQKTSAQWRPSTPIDFVREVLPHAHQAAASLGIHPLALVAQAAVETGWGRHVMSGHDGASSFNLFGIKAGGEWSGAKVSKRTLEVEAGTAIQKQAHFRSYSSMAESFSDYVKVITQSPRYREVLEHGKTMEGFAEAIGRSGYATDPEYANKIKGILNGQTLREALRTLKLPGFGPMT
jgi:peptidoglycan hydrolase FlgJ